MGQGTARSAQRAGGRLDVVEFCRTVDVGVMSTGWKRGDIASSVPTDAAKRLYSPPRSVISSGGTAAVLNVVDSADRHSRDLRAVAARSREDLLQNASVDLDAAVDGTPSTGEHRDDLHDEAKTLAPASHVFGPHFRYKMRHIVPVGVMFGIKYGITNWGLALVPTAKHLLLQSTDLVWTVLFAYFWNCERLGVIECGAAVLSIVGAVCVCLAKGDTWSGEGVTPLGLGVNLLTPVFLALCITTLRSGTAELFRKDNRLRGTMTALE